MSGIEKTVNPGVLIVATEIHELLFSFDQGGKVREEDQVYSRGKKMAG